MKNCPIEPTLFACGNRKLEKFYAGTFKGKYEFAPGISRDKFFTSHDSNTGIGNWSAELIPYRTGNVALIIVG
jgi:hypothetical protein